MISRAALRQIYLDFCQELEIVPDSIEADYMWTEYCHDLKTLNLIEKESSNGE